MLRSRFSPDDGSAPLEFIVAGMVLLVPVVYLVLTVSTIQAGSMAVEGASRQAARVFVEANTEADARADAAAAIDVALADYGLDSSNASVTISCSPDPRNCLTRRGFVTVRVAESVALPLVPPVLDLNVALAVPLSSSATEQVSRFSQAGQ